ncbi:T9SS type A sorting domain-containing protein, partial [Candidatus Zixiibacteriota bacterium]
NFDFQDVRLEQYHVLEENCFQELVAPKGNKIFTTLNSGQTLTWTYDPDSVYYQFKLSPDTPANDSMHVVFRMTDDDFNVWQDTLAIFVTPLQYTPQYGLMNLVSGSTEGRLEYMIMNPTLLTGHAYRLFFHEHIDELRYDLTDYTTATTLLHNQEFPDIYGLNSQIVDGFRVIQGTAENIAYGYHWDWTSIGSRWLSWHNWGGSLFHGAIGVGREFFGSTLHDWEYKDVRIDFDPWGVTTSNCKVYRQDLDYTVQPGFGTFNGAAWDVSDPVYPSRLNIVFVESDWEKPADMIWNPDNSTTGGSEYLFVMNSQYNPLTAGGYGDDEPMWGPAADVLWAYWPKLRGGHSFLENYSSFTLYVNPCLVREGDIFGFMPLWTGIEHEGQSLPRDFSLKQNYPNPFNPVTTIQYVLPISGRVELAIYNVLGQRIDKLVDELQKADAYQVSWDGNKFASGVYFCRLKAGDFRKTIKMVLLR